MFKKSYKLEKNKKLHRSKNQIIGLGLALTSSIAIADGRLEGVINSDANKNLAGAKVRINELNLETITKRDGRFSFPLLEAGKYTISIEYLGAQKKTVEVTINDDKTTSETIQLALHKVTEQVTVIGQAARANKALNSQRHADNMITVVSADAIGQFPDTNVSEALQRLPGLSIERDQGEGRFVRVRGLSPDLNGVTINGTKIPSPESGTRAVALDVVPSDLLEALEVTKTLTPDMDADSLGGNIEVKSLSAFDRDGFFYSISSEASNDQHEGETSPKFAATASNILSVGEGVDNLGIAFSTSWYDRDFGSDNVETGGGWSDGFLEEVEQRDYRLNRKRTGMALNLDYKLNQNNDLYFRTLVSNFEDSETRLANIFEFVIEEDDDGNITDTFTEAKRELKDRYEEQEITSFVFGGETRNNDWTYQYSAAISESGEYEPLHIDAAEFKRDDFDGLLDFSDSTQPNINLPSSFFDSSTFELDEIELTESDTNDKEQNIRLDLERDLTFNNNPATIKFGGKISRREKDNDETVYKYDDEIFGEQLLSNFVGGNVDYALGNFGQEILTNPLLALTDTTQGFEEEDSKLNDYELKEDINALYVMSTVDIDDLRLIFGARYEDTQFETQGYTNNTDDESIIERKVSNDYSKTLPSFHARYRLNDNTIIRGAWTNSLVRPSFDQLSPKFIVDDEELEQGNPELDAIESSNFDISIEYYLGYAGIVSAAVFYKDIDNFIYESVTKLDEANADGFEEITTFKNSESAELTGVELAYSKQFNALPAPWNGLLLAANATFTDSEATIRTEDASQRDIALPSQSDTTANLSIGYEDHRMSLRLSNTFKSSYLTEVQAGDADSDIFEDDHNQIDFTAKAFVNENFQAYFKAININDEPYYTYQGRKEFNAQYEEYGPTYQIGFQLTNF